MSLSFPRASGAAFQLVDRQRNRGLCVVLAAVAASVLFGCQTPSVAMRQVDLAIDNVTVIDPETRQVLPAHSVHVSGKNIVAVTPTRRRSGFQAKVVIDGSNRYLIPGLIDMHVHLFLPEPATPSLSLLLANGVTGIREMSSDCWSIAGGTKGCVDDYRQLQLKIRAGEVQGPELLTLTSTMVMGPTRLDLPEGVPSYITPVTRAEARTLVRHLASRGTEMIKTHDSLPTEAFPALMQEATRLGMKVGGHVPFAEGSVGAALMGYDSIEHARDLLYDCSRYGPEFRRQEAAFADGVPGSQRPLALERLQRTVADFDPIVCNTLLTKLARTDVYYTPTHSTREMEARANEPIYRANPERKYILSKRLERWEEDLDETAALPAEQRQALTDFFVHGLRLTGLAHRAGVPVMAGTDASDTMIVPGFSLHNELRLLKEAGLSNMDVLRSATSVPAAYLDRSSELGGISAGKEADLVLLRRNPLQDIRNSSSIETVISNGIPFARSSLDALLAAAEQFAAGEERKPRLHERGQKSGKKEQERAWK